MHLRFMDHLSRGAFRELIFSPISLDVMPTSQPRKSSLTARQDYCKHWFTGASLEITFPRLTCPYICSTSKTGWVRPHSKPEINKIRKHISRFVLSLATFLQVLHALLRRAISQPLSNEFDAWGLKHLEQAARCTPTPPNSTPNLTPKNPVGTLSVALVPSGALALSKKLTTADKSSASAVTCRVPAGASGFRLLSDHG